EVEGAGAGVGREGGASSAVLATDREGVVQQHLRQAAPALVAAYGQAVDVALGDAVDLGADQHGRTDHGLLGVDDDPELPGLVAGTFQNRRPELLERLPSAIRPLQERV